MTIYKATQFLNNYKKKQKLFNLSRPILYIDIDNLTRFLRDAWTDFHEIFREGRYWAGIENVEPDF